jgi:hypothetical protein
MHFLKKCCGAIRGFFIFFSRDGLRTTVTDEKDQK